jgi:glycosyltransferase involved in cell wall biosynthesis
VLKAFERLYKSHPDAELLLAGEFHSSDLARAVEPYLASPGVRRLGHMSEIEFATAASAIDCCINLRYPLAGETSGIGVRMMGLGKPVISSQGGEIASLPQHTYLAVEPGLREESHLFELMCVLLHNPELGREIGRWAAAHVLRYHSIKAVSEQYWKTLCDTCS